MKKLCFRHGFSDARDKATVHSATIRPPIAMPRCMNALGHGPDTPRTGLLA